MDEVNEKKISIRFTHDPPVYELGEQGRFQITFEFFKAYSSDDDPRPLTFSTKDSVFDVPSALSQGLLEVVDLETDNRVEIPTKAVLAPPESPATEQNSDIEKSFYTLLPFDRSCPRQSTNILYTYTPPSPQSPGAWPLEAGRKYVFRLTSNDLGIKWWNYGTETNLDLPSQPGRLSRCCSSPSHHIHRHGLPTIKFLAVPPLPHPPPITIKLSLTAPVFDRDNPRNINVRISTTNHGDRPITAKNRYEQPNGDITRRPVTVIGRDDPHRPGWVPARNNLSTIEVATGRDLTHGWGPLHTPTAGPQGYVRTGFTTLEPGVPFEAEIWVLSENSPEDVTGDELRITLRPYEVWWKWGTLDEVFEGQKKLPRNRLFGGYTPPLKLESSDELTLRIVGKGIGKCAVEVAGGL